MDYLTVKPLKESDLDFFCKAIKHNKRNGFNFFLNRFETKKDFKDWYKQEYGETDVIDVWLICYLKNKRVGGIYYHGDVDCCEVSIFMAPYWKNKGLGKLFLMLGQRWIKKNCQDIDFMWAEISKHNKACRKVFTYNGFKADYVSGVYMGEYSKFI